MSDIFDTNCTFAELGLRDSVLKGVDAEGFEHPTDIQARLIPLILEGRHVFGQARTGTGKTAAFGLPMLHLVEAGMPVQALALVPTRELAIQVCAELTRLGKFTPIRSLAIYGGQPIPKQIAGLKENPEIIVGTPGRVMDLQNRGVLKFHNIKFALLDEVDRMLDIGFREDIRKILKLIHGRPQSIFVSATISPEIEKLAHEFMDDPVKIETVAGSLTVSQVEQSYFTVEPWDKQKLLFHLLTHEDPDLTLVFCRMKVTVDRIAKFLRNQNIDASAIHGDLFQTKRNALMQKLRAGSLSVVVASDLAARGLDVSGISHVVNFDLPEDPEVYIHRIGRTARAGKHGVAWSFVTPDQGKLLTEIELLANTEIPHNSYPDFKPGPIPKDIKAQMETEEARNEKLSHQRNRYSGPAPVWDKDEEQVDTDKFPGGVAPKAKPKRRLGGKFRTRRGR